LGERGDGGGQGERLGIGRAVTPLRENGIGWDLLCLLFHGLGLSNDWLK